MNQEFIRFEGDVLRRHASYRLPLICVVEGRRYAVAEWSVAGVVLEERSPGIEIGKLYDIGLIFPFEGYDFTLDLQARAEVIEGIWQLQYANPTPSQISMFRFILDAYLTGEMVTAGEILDMSRRDEPASGGKDKRAVASVPSWRRGLVWLGRGLWLVIIAAVIVGLATFISGSIAQKFSLISTESAMVSIDSVPSFAVEAGVVTNLASGSVKAGDPLATIMTASHNSTTTFAPCDCVVDTALTPVGSSVSAGEKIALLRPADATPYVTAWIDRNHVIDLYRGAAAEVELPNGDSLKGLSLRQAPLVSDDKVKRGDLVPVEIALPTDGPSLVPGEPVVVRFLRPSPVTAQGLLASASGTAAAVAQSIQNLFQHG